jgi:hypothetical protein
MTIQANFPNVQPSLLLDFANAKQLPPQVTFTRATSATYYDGSTTAKAEENLLLYSQTFSAWWTALRTSLTANATTAPDGTNTATLIYPSSTGGETIIYPPSFSTTQTHTLSCYAKASGKSFLMLEITASTLTRTAWFNLSTGTLGTVGANISSASITSVGNGWYRCVITFTVAGEIRGNIGLSDSDGSYSITASGTNGIFIWGAQLEQRSTATAYTATTTQPITNYIPVLLTAGGGQPRFDHNPTTSESLGLEIEEQRTNLQIYSSAFQDNSWTKLDALIGINEITAPDGTLTGDQLIPNTSSAFHIMYGGTAGASGTHTMSVFAKANGYPRMAIRESNVTGNGALFDLSAGTVISLSNATATITPVGNGWYRCTATLAWNSTYNMGIAVAQSTDTSLLPSFTGNGFSGIFIWGAQLEAGAFATSYIPTTTAAATRAADIASMTGANFSSWYSPGNGTFYAEASTASVASDVMIAEGTNSSGAFLDFSLTFATTSTQFINRFAASNNDIRRSGAVAANTMVKFSGSITNSTGTTVGSTAGVAMTVSTSQVALYGADRMFIGSRGGSSLFLNAPIRKLAFYPAQLTQTQQNSITG